MTATTTPRARNMLDRAAAQPFSGFGEQLAAVKKAAVNREVDPRLRYLNDEFQAATGMSESVPSEGGFAVAPQFSDRILMKAYEVGEILGRCNKTPIAPDRNGFIQPAIDETSRADGSRMGGIRGYWGNEASTVTASQLKGRTLEMYLEQLFALVYVTDEMAQDIVALSTKMETIVSQELVFKVENAIVAGTGAGQPLGIINSGACLTIDKETGQAADTIQVENVLKMYARCWGRSRRKAVWVVNQDIEPELLTMGITVGFGGQAIFMPIGDASTSPYPTLMGRPIVPVEYCSTLGDLGDIVFADFSQYEFIDRGIRGATSIHVKFLEGETAFRFAYRLNGQPGWDSPLTPFNGSNTQSPFVTLAERA